MNAVSAADAGTGAALPRYRCAVAQDWIDYNGHMSEAFYVLVFGFATDAVMETLGIDADYRRESDASLYTVEAHVRYLDETSLGDELEVRTTIVGAGAKKLHLAHEMRVIERDSPAEPAADASGEPAGRLAATEEIMALHVSTAGGRSAPFPAQIAENIARYRTSRSEPPDWTGRSIGV